MTDRSNKAASDDDVFDFPSDVELPRHPTHRSRTVSSTYYDHLISKDLVIQNPSLHYQIPKRRTIYSDVSDEDILECRSSHEPSLQVSLKQCEIIIIISTYKCNCYMHDGELL